MDAGGLKLSIREAVLVIVGLFGFITGGIAWKVGTDYQLKSIVEHLDRQDKHMESEDQHMLNEDDQLIEHGRKLQWLIDHRQRADPR